MTQSNQEFPNYPKFNRAVIRFLLQLIVCYKVRMHTRLLLD